MNSSVKQAIIDSDNGLIGAKELSELMPMCCKIDTWKQISFKFESNYHNFNEKEFEYATCEMPIMVLCVDVLRACVSFVDAIESRM